MPEGATRPVIGVTGAPGSGKTSVAREFGRLGARVLALDEIGHDLLRDEEVREQLRETFSVGVFRIMDGAVSRRKLGGLVFGDPAELVKLNAIMHPRITGRVREELGRWRSEPEGPPPAVVVEGALLLEMGLGRDCDHVVLVTAPRDERARRLAASREWEQDELDRRERSQMSDDERRSRAEVVVDNASGLAELRRAVAALWEEWT